VATAFGVEVDHVEVGPQQLQGQPIPLAEVSVGAEESDLSNPARRRGRCESAICGMASWMSFARLRAGSGTVAAWVIKVSSGDFGAGVRLLEIACSAIWRPGDGHSEAALEKRLLGEVIGANAGASGQ
jgi:hypothetical protein